MDQCGSEFAGDVGAGEKAPFNASAGVCPGDAGADFCAGAASAH
jgi:hypothetical protein